MGGISYLTLCGPSEWATFNSMWAVLKHHSYVPDKIYIFSFEEDKERAELSKNRLRILLDVYGKDIEPEIVTVDDSDIDGIVHAFRSVLEKERSNEISLDVTNGRKLMAMCALKAWPFKDYAHVFELYIKTLREVNYPYMCIPLSLQHLYDLREG